MTRSKKTLYTMLTSVGPSIILVFLGFYKVSVFQTVFGSEIQGLNVVLFGIASIIGITDAGFTTAFIQKLFHPLAHDNKEETQKIVSTIRFVMKRVAFAILIIALVFGLITDYIITSSSTVFDTGFVFLAFMIMIIPNVIAYAISWYSLVLQADQRSYIFNIYSQTALIISNLLFIYLALNFPKYLLVQFIATFPIIIAGILCYFKTKKLYPWLNLKSKYYDLSYIKDSKYLIVHQVSTLVFVNTDSILISITHGLASTTIFYFYQLVAISVKNLFGPIVFSSFASFGHIFASESNDRSRAVFREFSIFVLIISTLIPLMVMIGSVSFISYLFGPIEDIVNYQYAFWFGLVLFIEFARFPMTLVANTLGYFKETAKFAVFETIINLCVSFIALKFIGVHGVLIGTFTAFFIDFIVRSKEIIPLAFNKELKKMYFRHALSLVILISLYFIQTPIINQIFPNVFPDYGKTYLIGWFLKMIPVFIFNTVLVFGIYAIFFKKEVSLIINRIMRLARLKK